VLVLQPLDEQVERVRIDKARMVHEQLTRLVRRGQEGGDLRADLPADCVLTTITWLVLGAADGLRPGLVAPAQVELLTATVLGALRR